MATAERYPKRLIEVDLPIKRISAHARREKSIRHGHISTLHIWWARRPLAACRSVLCAALWPDPADELTPETFREAARELMSDWARQHLGLCSPESYGRFLAIQRTPAMLRDNTVLRLALLDFIADFANWDNCSVREFLETSRGLTRAAHDALGAIPGTNPLVIDPFAGGGAIPVEALRIGADTFASDLNPVAVLLNKVLLEYIPKYGQQLADEVRKWGEWIRREAAEELRSFYPSTPEGGVPIVYFWARSITSEAPGPSNVAIEVPLLRSMWLAKKAGRKFALRWSRDSTGAIKTQTRKISAADGTDKDVIQPLLEVFQPRSLSEVEPGTSKGGAATCPITGFTTAVEGVRLQLTARRGGAADARLIAVVADAKAGAGRVYRAPLPDDEDAFARAREKFYRTVQNKECDVGLPMGDINHLRGFFNIVLYGMTHWGDLFSPRQALSIITFARFTRKIGEISELEKELSTAVQTCLALVLDRLAEKLSSAARWDVTRENAQGTFGRQALPMVWDFCEVNPFSGAGGDWDTALDWVAKVIESNAEPLTNSGIGHAEQASATKHPLPNESVSCVFTDPPYYAAVPYADLSDFFYSWLKQTVGPLYPTMFAKPLSPKSRELVSLSHRAAMYREKTGPWFEAHMAEACNECRRICEAGGIGVFVFANKETAGWEAMLSALISSGWIITASWPIDTEMASRLRARNSAVLSSSIHLVGRPRENLSGPLSKDEIGDWRDVLQELPVRIHEWMPRLAEEGVVGADAIFACLGPALEIFSRYPRVEKASGETVSLKEYLEQVWAAVAREALTMVFQDADVTGFEGDARLTAMWLWTLKAGSNGNGGGAPVDSEEDDEEDEVDGKKSKVGGFELEYDAARKIAQGLGAHLEALGGIVEVRGERARLLPVAERTRYLFGKEESEPARVSQKKKSTQPDLFAELTEAGGDELIWPDMAAPHLGETILDRLHQSMILFGAGRGEALKRFLVEEGAGRDGRFWSLAQALSALFPIGTDEKRWVDGVLARKRSLGF